MAPSSAGCTRRPAANTALISTPSAVLASPRGASGLGSRSPSGYQSLLGNLSRSVLYPFLRLFAWREKETPRDPTHEQSADSHTATPTGCRRSSAQRGTGKWRAMATALQRAKAEVRQPTNCVVPPRKMRATHLARSPAASEQEHARTEHIRARTFPHMRAFFTRRHSTKSTHKHTALRGDGFG